MVTHSNNLTKLAYLIDRTFNTESGEDLLALLKEEFCSGTAVQPTVERTYYALGQRELIELFISIKDNPDILKEATVKSDFNVDY